MRNFKFRESMDARVWVEAWLNAIRENPSIPTDEETMFGWFANALERGRTEGEKIAREKPNETDSGLQPFECIECGATFKARTYRCCQCTKKVI